MAERVEHWFNRRYGLKRCDVFLICTETGWQVLGREGGADGRDVTHYFDHGADARRMLQRMLAAVPSELSDWAKMTQVRRREKLIQSRRS